MGLLPIPYQYANHFISGLSPWTCFSLSSPVFQNVAMPVCQNSLHLQCCVALQTESHRALSSDGCISIYCAVYPNSHHMTVDSVQSRSEWSWTDQPQGWCFVRQVKFHFAETLSCFCLLRKTSLFFFFFYTMVCDSDLLLVSFPPRMQPFCMALEWCTSTITPFSGEYN